MKALEIAVKAAGGQTALANKLNGKLGEKLKTPLKQGHVWAWLFRDGGIPPAEYCIAIEEIVDGAVTRYDLNPNVFGEAPVKSKKVRVA